jgi:hypothetical protein
VREQIFSTLKKPRCKGLIQIATNRFFLMTTEYAEIFISDSPVRVLRPSALKVGADPSLGGSEVSS